MAQPTATETVRMPLEDHQDFSQVFQEHPTMFKSKNDFLVQAIRAFCDMIQERDAAEERKAAKPRKTRPAAPEPVPVPAPGKKRPQVPSAPQDPIPSAGKRRKN